MIPRICKVQIEQLVLINFHLDICDLIVFAICKFLIFSLKASYFDHFNIPGFIFGFWEYLLVGIAELFWKWINVFVVSAKFFCPFCYNESLLTMESFLWFCAKPLLGIRTVVNINISVKLFRIRFVIICQMSLRIQIRTIVTESAYRYPTVFIYIFWSNLYWTIWKCYIRSFRRNFLKVPFQSKRRIIDLLIFIYLKVNVFANI